MKRPSNIVKATDRCESVAVPGVRNDLLRWLPETVSRSFRDQCAIRSIPAGQLIFQYGDERGEMYRVLRGTVRISTMRVDGLEMIYALLGPGECLGASSLIDGERMPQTAEALDDVKIQVLSSAAFSKLRETYRVFDDALLRLLSSRLRMMSAHMANAVLADPPNRVALRLLEVAHVAPDGALHVSITQAALALLTGASRQTVNKVLKQLESKDLVRLTYRRIELRNINKLKRMAEII
ncbi:Crp/Fnr family transcriptional regulator [Bradyrhizobium sp. JR3.5]